ncbi:uncharacterized protein [Dysidea avara]|uniref:uncharacterized protein n=1 Tax=Dysidea avara TaxID=196820 RepID=UPI00332BC919
MDCDSQTTVGCTEDLAQHDKGSMLDLLRLYEEINPFHKIDYSMDGVYMELEDEKRKPGEVLMYLSLDVHTWMQIRNQCGRPELRRIGNYVLGTSADRHDFDKFRDSEFYKQRPLLKTELLARFMKEKCITASCCNKYGIEFVLNFPSTEFDNLCEWTRNLLGISHRSDHHVYSEEDSPHSGPLLLGNNPSSLVGTVNEASKNLCKSIRLGKKKQRLPTKKNRLLL